MFLSEHAGVDRFLLLVNGEHALSEYYLTLGDERVPHVLLAV